MLNALVNGIIIADPNTGMDIQDLEFGFGGLNNFVCFKLYFSRNGGGMVQDGGDFMYRGRRRK